MVLVTEDVPRLRDRRAPVRRAPHARPRRADDKILAVPLHDPYHQEWFDIADIPRHVLKEVEHFSSGTRISRGSGSRSSDGRRVSRRWTASWTGSSGTTNDTVRTDPELHAAKYLTERISRRSPREAPLPFPSLGATDKGHSSPSSEDASLGGSSRRRTFVCTSAISAQPVRRMTVSAFQPGSPFVLGSPPPWTLAMSELMRLTT